jgi:hypothetical protein
MVLNQKILLHQKGPLDLHVLVTSLLQRNGDIIKDTTPILQFWSEMQQTWHIYSQRPQNSETGINFFILFSTVPFRAPQKRRFLGTYSGHRALTSRYFLRATSVKLVHVLNKNFGLKGLPIS